jgi:hypothetical protein
MTEMTLSTSGCVGTLPVPPIPTVPASGSSGSRTTWRPKAGGMTWARGTSNQSPQPESNPLTSESPQGGSSPGCSRWQGPHGSGRLLTSPPVAGPGWSEPAPPSESAPPVALWFEPEPPAESAPPVSLSAVESVLPLSMRPQATRTRTTRCQSLGRNTSLNVGHFAQLVHWGSDRSGPGLRVTS